MVVRLRCEKKKKKKLEILAMDGSLFHFFLFEVVIRSHGKICPRLYRINEEDVNFMKRSAKCRPVQSAVSKQSLRVSKSLSLFPLSRLYHNVDFLFFCYISPFRNNSNRCRELFKFNQLFLFHHCE